MLSAVTIRATMFMKPSEIILWFLPHCLWSTQNCQCFRNTTYRCVLSAQNHNYSHGFHYITSRGCVQSTKSLATKPSNSEFRGTKLLVFLPHYFQSYAQCTKSLVLLEHYIPSEVHMQNCVTSMLMQQTNSSVQRTTLWRHA